MPPLLPLRVLILDDSPDDTLILLYHLQAGGYTTVPERLQNAAAMRAALARQPWDLILSDHAMPCFSAPEALEVLKESRLDIPFIIVSAEIDQDLAVALMRAGAHDFIRKDDLARLLPSVERELREADDRRLRRQAEADLRASEARYRAAHAQLRQVAQQMMCVQEEERRRVARELHDVAGQGLTALRIHLELMRADLPAEPGPLAPLYRHLGETITLVETTMDDIRLLAQNLRPPAIDAMGLSAALEGHCREFARLILLPVEYTGVSLVSVPEPVSLSLYRFLQEALTNVAKHAGATRVSVSFRADLEKIELTVQDNGKGFGPQPPAQTGGLGLLGMQERLALVGGRLEIVSRPGAGARLTVRIPYPEAA